MSASPITLKILQKKTIIAIKNSSLQKLKASEKIGRYGYAATQVNKGDNLYIRLFHVGKGKNDWVKIYDAENDTWKQPFFDVGGLGNIKKTHKLTKQTVTNTTFRDGLGYNETELANALSSVRRYGLDWTDFEVYADKDRYVCGIQQNKESDLYTRWEFTRDSTGTTTFKKSQTINLNQKNLYYEYTDFNFDLSTLLN